jgi:hypothetical protein
MSKDDSVVRIGDQVVESGPSPNVRTVKEIRTLDSGQVEYKFEGLDTWYPAGSKHSSWGKYREGMEVGH